MGNNMIDVTKWTLLLQVASTLAMVGLIWFVQVVHYPLLSRVGRDEFRRYEMDHQRLTTCVVAPLMLTELATAFLLIWYRPAAINIQSAVFGFGILLTIWLVTYTVQVPQHSTLVLAYDAATQRRLVLGNWYRTLAWSARGILVLWMLGRLLPAAINSTAGKIIHSSLP